MNEKKIKKASRSSHAHGHAHVPAHGMASGPANSARPTRSGDWVGDWCRLLARSIGARKKQCIANQWKKPHDNPIAQPTAPTQPTHGPLPHAPARTPGRALCERTQAHTRSRTHAHARTHARARAWTRTLDCLKGRRGSCGFFSTQIPAHIFVEKLTGYSGKTHRLTHSLPHSSHTAIPPLTLCLCPSSNSHPIEGLTAGLWLYPDVEV